MLEDVHQSIDRLLRVQIHWKLPSREPLSTSIDLSTASFSVRVGIVRYLCLKNTVSPMRSLLVLGVFDPNPVALIVFQRYPEIET